MTDATDFSAHLERLNRTGWSEIDDGAALSKTFQFEDFAEAFVWMTAVAFVAEQMQHHPTWANAYDVVDVTLTSFEVGRLTEKDMLLARKMDEAAGHA